MKRTEIRVKAAMRFMATLLVFFALSVIRIAQERSLPPALASLVAAEREFSNASVQNGVRDSFLAFFADDGINFQPFPVITKQNLLSRPTPASRPPVTLKWEPAFADISSAGDLGYTTGPYWWTDESPQHRPSRYGYYFSIWKKQKDGSWKVAVDAGIETPGASPSPASISFPPQTQYKRANVEQSVLDSQSQELITTDERFSTFSLTSGTVKAFRRYLSKSARVHRNGMFPLTGRMSILSYLGKPPTALKWQPLRSGMALSGDRGYTYGSYELIQSISSGTNTEKGYYVHVWKRKTDGNLELVLDTTTPIPPEQKVNTKNND